MENSKKSNDNRKNYEENQLNKNIIQYYIELGSTFNSTLNRLSHIIGSEHFPSVGEYKEKLLLKEIEKFLPSNFSIGTGFVIFPKFEKKNDKSFYSHNISKQLDIIIYDNTKMVTVFKDDSFVIIVPEQVLAIIEVKGVNSKNQKPIDIYKDFYDKWEKYYFLKEIDTAASNNSDYKLKPPTFFSYMFDEYVDENNRVFDEEKGFEYVYEELKEFIDKKELTGQAIFQPENDHPFYPFVTKFGGYFVYNKYFIIGCPDNDGTYLLCSLDGYYNDSNYDKTFLNLLINIFESCGISFNGNIIIRDQEIFHEEVIRAKKTIILKKKHQTIK